VPQPPSEPVNRSDRFLLPVQALASDDLGKQLQLRRQSVERERTEGLRAAERRLLSQARRRLGEELE